jgi:uncharacterized protein
MSNSLRDQLLGLGFKSAPKPEPKSSPRPSPSPKPTPRHGGKPGAAGRSDRPAAKPSANSGSPPAGKRGGQGRGGGAAKPRRSQEEIDLGRAYALRAQKEKQERIDAERAKQEAARLRREARARLAAFLGDKTLNDPEAEIARHFEYGGKIKRIYVNEAQLKALNAGELGVLQQEGRYLLVTAAVLAEAEAIFAPAVALKVDPNAPAGDDPYADPKYQVPDDLVW